MFDYSTKRQNKKAKQTENGTTEIVLIVFIAWQYT